MLAIVTEQKTLKMLPSARHDVPDDAAQPDQIAHGFMISVGHPDGRQFSGPVKPGEHGRVSTICFHPIARLRRNQRRRHHVAPMAEACELVMNAVATQRQRPRRPHSLLTAPGSLAISPRYSTAPDRLLSATATEIRSL
jgi:hypothetical protein